jgi:hypothetical protein
MSEDVEHFARFYGALIENGLFRHRGREVTRDFLAEVTTAIDG